MEVWLKSHGYKVISCDSGQAALDLIKNEKPTLVFLDLIMPEGVDGLETLRLIRENNKDLPVILLTAYGTDELVNEATKLGIDGFLSKTEPFGHVYTLLQTVLKKLE